VAIYVFTVFARSFDDPADTDHPQLSSGHVAGATLFYGVMAAGWPGPRSGTGVTAILGAFAGGLVS
jgi:membrane-associated phospholipid phosphatase